MTDSFVCPDEEKAHILFVSLNFIYLIRTPGKYGLFGMPRRYP